MLKATSAEGIALGVAFALAFIVIVFFCRWFGDPKATGEYRAESERLQQAGKLIADAGRVERLSEQLSPDEHLLSSFLKMLRLGVNVGVLTEGGQVVASRMWAKDSDGGGLVLMWAPRRGILESNHSLDLTHVSSVKKGKRTEAFEAQPATGLNADRCFSLLSHECSANFVVSSKMEREAIAQGFTLVLEQLSASTTV